MCLAIYKPAKAIIPTNHLENGYEGNPMGCGFCWPEGGKVRVVKGMYAFKEFLALYREVEQKGFPMLIHFRMATHGGKNEFNCHPFSMANGKFALIHNGVIPIAVSKDKEGREMSDTNTFATLVMEPMLVAGISPRKPAFRFLVEQTVGGGNKICVMSADGEVMIYNKGQGDFEDAVDKDGNKLETDGEPVKIWYSNCGYKWSRTRNRFDDDDDDYWGASCRGRIPIGFHGRAKLDTPPNIIGLPAKNADGTKSAKESAEAMQTALEARATTPIQLTDKTPKSGNKEETETVSDEPEKGPIFSAKVELEITYLIQNMHMSRDQAIKTLQLKMEDSIAYVD